MEKTPEKVYRKMQDAALDLQKGKCEHKTFKICTHCDKYIINPDGFEKVKRGWAVYKSVRPGYYHDKCWDEALIEAHKREVGKRKDFLLYFGKDMDIKITDVKEVYKEAENWEIELAIRLKNRIQEHIGRSVRCSFLEDLLDKEGVREYVRSLDVESGKEDAGENTWDGIIYTITNDEGKYNYISFRTLPPTEAVLYLRKPNNQNEFRIGTFEIYMVDAGMGVRPELKKLQDLVSICYETE